MKQKSPGENDNEIFSNTKECQTHTPRLRTKNINLAKFEISIYQAYPHGLIQLMVWLGGLGPGGLDSWDLLMNGIVT